MREPSLYGKSGVYQIRCKVTDKVYIGQSKNLGRRFSEHRSALSRGIHRNPELQRDYDLYGNDSISYDVIIIGECDLDALEKELISKARCSDKCYNVFDGGSKGAQPNQAWREKVSRGNRGKKLSPEQRQFRSLAAKRQWENVKYREIMVNSAKKQWCDDSYRSKMLAAHTGRGNDSASKLTTDIVREARSRYARGENISDLARTYSVTYCTMLNAVKGRTWKHVS